MVVYVNNLYLFERSFKELHKLLTFVSTVLMKHLQPLHASIGPKVNRSTLLQKLFRFVLLHIMLAAVPHEHCIFLSHIVARLSFGA